MCLFFFFFFQAEDGIRDVAVTGVQTCALPILDAPAAVLLGSIVNASCVAAPGATVNAALVVPVTPVALAASVRSEEHTSELQSRLHLVCRLLLEKKKKHKQTAEERHHVQE